jgi:hypothetical protein
VIAVRAADHRPGGLNAAQVEFVVVHCETFGGGAD